MFLNHGKHSAYRSQRTPQVVEEAIEPKDFGESTPIGTLLAISAIAEPIAPSIAAVAIRIWPEFQ
jgi:hypothetical protein